MTTALARAIVRIVADEYKVSQADIRGRSKYPYCIAPRFTAMRVMRDYDLSLNQIAKALSKRDHTTILNGLSRFSEMIADGDFAARYEAIKTRVEVKRGGYFPRELLRPVFKSRRAQA